MLPWIEKGLNKIPFFRNKKRITPNPLNMEEMRAANADEKEKMLEYMLSNIRKKHSRPMLPMKKYFACVNI
jgi:hypothetical protein